MTDGRDPASPVQTGRSGKAPLGRLIALLASVSFASSVVAALAVACVIGTLLPQGEEVARYLRKNPGGMARMERLDFLGLTHVFSCWWFLALLGLLALSLTICTFRRGRAALKSKGRARGRAIGSMLTHISLLLVLAGGVMRGVFGERGQMPLHEGDTKAEFVEDGTTVALPFSIHLVKFELEVHSESPAVERKARIIDERLLVKQPETGRQWKLSSKVGTEKRLKLKGGAAGATGPIELRVVRKVADFVVDTRGVANRSDEPRNPALLVETVAGGVTNQQWLFAFHPDFNMHGADGAASVLDFRYEVKVDDPGKPQVKDYKSTLQVLDGTNVVVAKTIEVNAPLRYGGYTFYQSGFNPQDLKWTSLQVVRDPGVPVVYAGFLFMIIGLAAVFYLYPQAPPGRPRRSNTSEVE
ncbi:MAG: cytochrome c biogenesis protein ResB [Candidatus Marinimicrobia bacterium]|nr:cytochrome c biogenesis protein ResB [Candidatus Neomarinimicrobiota bacterium]